MSAPATGLLCQLHDDDTEHLIILLEGVELDDGRIVAADQRCGRAFPEHRRHPATRIDEPLAAAGMR